MSVLLEVGQACKDLMDIQCSQCIDGKLADAASIYAACAILHDHVDSNERKFHEGASAWQGSATINWPWESKLYQPKNRRDDLLKAAALIILEIELLDIKHSQLKG